MKSSLDKAAAGIPPNSECDVPKFLTPEKTLQILEKIMKTSAEKIREAFKLLKSQGIILF